MKHIILSLIILFLTACSSTTSKSIWVSQDNFAELPAYRELKEFEQKPKNAVCSTKECNKATSNNDTLYKAILLDEDNYTDYLIGKWTGSSCDTDHWLANKNGTFKSQYPNADGIYAWSGKYFFKDNVYIEDGVNANGNKEWNEAQLYFLPEAGLLVYKGIRNFESYNDDSSINYTYYEGSDFFYFKRCN